MHVPAPRQAQNTDARLMGPSQEAGGGPVPATVCPSPWPGPARGPGPQQASGTHALARPIFSCEKRPSFPAKIYASSSKACGRVPFPGSPSSSAKPGAAICPTLTLQHVSQQHRLVVPSRCRSHGGPAALTHPCLLRVRSLSSPSLGGAWRPALLLALPGQG